MDARHTLLAAALAAIFPMVAVGAEPGSAPAQTAAAAVAPAPHIATVDGRRVTVEEFERAFGAVVRQKFYHRTPPEGQYELARVEVAEGLVERALALNEAEKLGMAVDEGPIREVIEGYEKQYGSSPNWAATRERALPRIKRELAQQQLLAKLEAGVRDVPVPDETEARAFYDANKPLFTEPERVHVSVILLRVDPSAPKAVRDKAREEGRELRTRLAQGADFAETARVQSSDASAAKGGDLGYLHRGMLAEAIHKEIDSLEPGAISPSMDVLDGVAVFKLHERAAAKLREYESVRTRAQELLRRENAERAWKQFLAGLRQAAKIETVAALYPAPRVAPAAGEKDAAWAVTDKPRGP